MSVEALFAAGAVLADAFQITLLVFLFVVAGRYFVMKVKNDSSEFHATLMHSVVVQTQPQFRVFISPALESFVESVDADQVPAPHPQVAASR